MLRDYLVSSITTPLSDVQVTARLEDRPTIKWGAVLREWLFNVQSLQRSWRIIERKIKQPNSWLIVDMAGPYEGCVGFRLLDAKEVLAGSQVTLSIIREESASLGVSQSILFLCADATKAGIATAVHRYYDTMVLNPDAPIIVEPTWAAAILIENLVPLLTGTRGPTVSLPSSGYFEGSDSTGPQIVSVRRSRIPLQATLGAVVDDPGTFAEKFRALKREGSYPFSGTILLATTFLPPVTHSVEAVQRFYRGHGITPESLALVKEKSEWERSQWIRHVSCNKRIDLFDKDQIEEYFAAPEYYQMPLSKDELKAQLQNTIALLEHENYSVAFASEALDLSYEIKEVEVRIRTDRRNKGQPRAGRISELLLSDRHMAEVFEREFWNMYRATEPRFKDKRAIANWLTDLFAKYKGPDATVLKGSDAYDVFLCHNSRDKPAVKQIARRLKERGLHPWLDEWDLIPGRPWQRVLEELIAVVPATAAFVGDDGLGPWQHAEVDAVLREAVSRNRPVIPVILPGLKVTPELPIFLRGHHWIDFGKDEPDPLDYLEWAIRGGRRAR